MPIERSDAAVVRSLEMARAPATTIPDQLRASEFLIACGLCDEADAALNTALARMEESRLQGSAVTMRMIERLTAINRRFRQAEMATQIEAMGPFADRLMDADDEAVLLAIEGSRTLLVVFGTRFNDFWVSFPVFHCMAPKDVSVLYLKDPRGLMYLGGLSVYGKDFGALCSGILGVAGRLGISDIRVTGFSSGGYAGLLLACAIGARGYLGFSGRTNLRPGSPLPIDRYAERPEMRQAVGNMMRDLKPWLLQCRKPGQALLYYGDSTVVDAAHAKHVADLPNFRIKQVPATQHNTIVTLLAEGSFEGILREFVA